jgi:hypothetical protein
MTEAEWLACTDVRPMLKSLHGKASNRKLRLFACACCRAVWSLFKAQSERSVIEVAERFADGLVSGAELYQSWRNIKSNSMVALTAAGVADSNAAYAASKTAKRAREVASVCGLQGAATRNSQATLLRDIIGNPYRALSLFPTVLTWNDRTIPKIAAGIYEERAFGRMPILHDALLDAGCDDEDILAHCRAEGPHVRGCWVIDLILGKS